jgi:hypothetical protein
MIRCNPPCQPLENGFCPECGGKPENIHSIPQVQPAFLTQCPVCGDSRVVGHDHCLVCHFDFSKRMPFDEESFPLPSIPGDNIKEAAHNLIVTINVMAAHEHGLQFQNSEPLRVRMGKTPVLVGRGNVYAFTPSDEVSLLSLADPGVSRKHAHITYVNGTVFYEDTGSSNGSLLNGVKISAMRATEMPRGGRIEIGAWTILTLE